MIFYLNMVNAWSLAWEELNGTMNETYPIKEKQLDMDLDAIAKSGGFEWTPGSPWPPEVKTDPDGGVCTVDGYEHSEYWYDYTRNDPNAKNPFTGDIKINTKVDQSESMRELSINKSDYKKYEEDKGIKDLQEYVTSTYNGHYTTKGSNVQTLDLIESVGDAPSFCRSNAIKYLSRYEKKGQAKRDILKAMHYCLLLYYFSGQTHDNEIQRGYETF